MPSGMAMITETIVANSASSSESGRRIEQLLDDGLPRPQRGAEVEAQHAPQPRAELHAQRLVQPEPLAHGGELLRVDVAGRVTAEDQQRHVARDDPHDQEHERRRPEQRGDDQEESLEDVGAHAARPPRLSPPASQTSWSFWLE